MFCRQLPRPQMIYAEMNLMQRVQVKFTTTIAAGDSPHLRPLTATAVINHKCSNSSQMQQFTANVSIQRNRGNSPETQPLILNANELYWNKLNEKGVLLNSLLPPPVIDTVGAANHRNHINSPQMLQIIATAVIYRGCDDLPHLLLITAVVVSYRGCGELSHLRWITAVAVLCRICDELPRLRRIAEFAVNNRGCGYLLHLLWIIAFAVNYRTYGESPAVALVNSTRPLFH